MPIPGGIGPGARFLVELHGGTAESDGIDRGRRFIVRLPLAARIAQPAGDK
jgi:hypothetical protein